jgi:hypothetical protein
MRASAPNQLWSRLLVCVAVAALQTTATAASIVLPDPLQLSEVTDIALRSRAEVEAAHARAEALAQRPSIVGALEDPMISPSIDHYPFNMMEGEGGQRYDWSVTVEQRFPLSGVRGYRRAAAHADAQRAKALANGTELDLVLEAHRSFFMLLERRRMRRVLDEQLRLAQQLVTVSSSRYASGTSTQADVLRAEVEVARAQSAQQSLAAEIRAAEAMLNASLGRPVQERVPELQYSGRHDEPLPVVALLDRALRSRPELTAGAAEVDRAVAEIDVMRSMYKPMATIRVGRASTMAEGPGAMCNAAYGNNGWLGIASISVSGSHIRSGTVRVNDTYFNTATYNTVAWRNLVMCQEVGHIFGLDHQDENFDNPNLGTCMDYTNLPSSNQHPNAHDYEELDIIYAHADATSAATAAARDEAPPAMDQLYLAGPAQWGRVTSRYGDGRPRVYELDFGRGYKIITHVFWVPGNGRR